MKKLFHLAPGNDAGSSDGNADHPRASGIDANVPVPKIQPGDEHAAVHRFQHQQAKFASGLLSPSFREG